MSEVKNKPTNDDTHPEYERGFMEGYYFAERTVGIAVAIAVFMAALLAFLDSQNYF